MGQFDAVFGNEASRRTFLKGVGVLGAERSAGSVPQECRQQQRGRRRHDGIDRPDRG